MAWEIVDGLRIPLPVAGVAALDFLNTRAGGRRRRTEPSGYRRWSSGPASAGGPTPPLAGERSPRRQDPWAADGVRPAALALREALRPVLVAGQGTPKAAGGGLAGRPDGGERAQARSTWCRRPTPGAGTVAVDRDDRAAAGPYLELVPRDLALLVRPTRDSSGPVRCPTAAGSSPTRADGDAGARWPGAATVPRSAPTPAAPAPLPLPHESYGRVRPENALPARSFRTEGGSGAARGCCPCGRTGSPRKACTSSARLFINERSVTARPARGSAARRAPAHPAPASAFLAARRRSHDITGPEQPS